MLVDEPQSLRHIEFSCIHFELEFQETVRLPPGAFLQMRRELLQVARFLDSALEKAPYSALFDPPLPTDPVVRKRIQRPGPGFVIRGIPPREHVFDVGDSFELTVHFLGGGKNALPDFVEILKMLGQNGLSQGRGLFDIATIAGEDPSGRRYPLCEPNEDLSTLAPPILDAQWWLDSAAPVRPSLLDLHFVTPARLVSQGRPLFRPTFRTIFPFILRRVTSMAQAYCGLELVENPAATLGAADRLQVNADTLRWTDWRRLEGESRSQDLGGVTGSIRLEGSALEEIYWILKLGSLLQIGKGAAYGAGRYDVHVLPG
ncbi:MAG: CRISPR system precrRNA processing endoribonuclease RAMP protein Cas6 [Desulfuromonadales bacterium]